MSIQVPGCILQGIPRTDQVRAGIRPEYIGFPFQGPECLDR